MLTIARSRAIMVYYDGEGGHSVSDLNPQMRYEFRSAKGVVVTITSRLGESAARTAAMEYLWGPAHGWCRNIGMGLHLLDTSETQA